MVQVSKNNLFTCYILTHRDLYEFVKKTIFFSSVKTLSIMASFVDMMSFFLISVKFLLMLKG